MNQKQFIAESSLLVQNLFFQTQLQPDFHQEKSRNNQQNQNIKLKNHNNHVKNINEDVKENHAKINTKTLISSSIPIYVAEVNNNDMTPHKKCDVMGDRTNQQPYDAQSDDCRMRSKKLRKTNNINNNSIRSTSNSLIKSAYITKDDEKNMIDESHDIDSQSQSGYPLTNEEIEKEKQQSGIQVFANNDNSSQKDQQIKKQKDSNVQIKQEKIQDNNKILAQLDQQQYQLKEQQQVQLQIVKKKQSQKYCINFQDDQDDSSQNDQQSSRHQQQQLGHQQKEPLINQDHQSKPKKINFAPHSALIKKLSINKKTSQIITKSQQENNEAKQLLNQQQENCPTAHINNTINLNKTNSIINKNKNVLLVDFGDQSEQSESQQVKDEQLQKGKVQIQKQHMMNENNNTTTFNNPCKKNNIFLNKFQDSEQQISSSEDYQHSQTTQSNNSNSKDNHKNSKYKPHKNEQKVHAFIKNTHLFNSSSSTSSIDQQAIIKPICISEFSNILSANDMSLAYETIPQQCVLQTVLKRYKLEEFQKNGNVLFEMFDSSTYKSLLKVKKVSQGFQMLWSQNSPQTNFKGNSKHLMSISPKTRQDISCALVTSNFFGTQFNCYKFNRNNEKPQERKLNRLITVDYESNFLGLNGPRKMQVYIPNIDCVVRGEKGLHQVYQQESKLQKQTIKNNTNMNVQKKVSKFVNRTPKWNNEISSFVLNFNGRATVSSVKNFIITEQNQQKKSNHFDKDLVIFGKIDKNIFNLDIKYPFNLVQGLALALSSFDKKLGCQ